MRLNNPLVNQIEFKGVEYSVDLAFDNVLDVFDVLDDKTMYEHERIHVCLKLLIDEQVTEHVAELWNYIYSDYIIFESEKPVQYDLEGNPLPVKSNKEESPYDLKQDAQYIYSSFQQAYGMNLFNEQGKLTWNEFRALLNGLPSNTILQKIIQIRTWEPTKGDSAEHIKDMRALQDVYKLHNESEVE